MIKIDKRYYLLMLLSGGAGLIYQIVWVRQLSLAFGATAYAVATTVAAFMAGLALGSAWFGKKADAHPSPLRLYLYLEVGIALAAVVSTILIVLLDETMTRLVDIESVGSTWWGALRFLVVFALLVAPTALMGGTLPTLARGIGPALDAVGGTVGSLYAANTYGGVAGALASGFLLIPLLGVMGATGVAVTLNLICAGLVWMVVKSGVEAPPRQRSTPRKKEKRAKSHQTALGVPTITDPVPMAFALLFLAGFCTLAFETLWTRAFVVSFKSTVYLFSNLLAVFLGGMALGSHLYARRIDQLRSPLKVFGVAQIAIGLLGMISLLIIYAAPDMAVSMAKGIGDMSFRWDATISLVLMTICFFPAAVLMGIAYPLICKVVTRSLEQEGTLFGKTYAIGSAGAILGALTAGFLILPGVGLQYGLILISGVSLVVGYVALFNSRGVKRPLWLVPTSALASLVLVGGVVISDIDIGLGAVTGGRVIYKSEGITGTVRVTQQGEKGPLTLMVNNYQLATSGDVAIRFGHLPLLLKPEAKEVALISLGSGITAAGVAAHDVTRIDCVELVPGLREAQAYFAPFNRKVLDDPRFHLTFWDGRHFIAASRRTYDLIISDLFQPDSAGVGSLYTVEHFTAAREKLKPNGMMAQWLPLYQLSPASLKIIMKTFAEAFPYVTVWFGDVNSELPTLMLAGSNEPLTIRPDRLFDTLNQPKVGQDMIEKDDPLSLLSFFVFGGNGVERFVGDAPLNTDNHPLIEYLAPRTLWHRHADAIENFASLAKLRQPVTPFILGASQDIQLVEALDRYYDARTLLLEGKVSYANRDFPGALKKYRKAERLAGHDPFLALAVFDLGYLYYQRRDYASSAKILAWSVRINPDLLEAHFYLAKAYQLAGNPKASQEVIQGLVRTHPDVARAMFQGS